jgi:membrane protease YdiL (CAAX protease family)
MEAIANDRDFREVKPAPVASYRHTIGLFVIAIVVLGMGLAAQHRPTAGGGLTNTHASAIPTYIVALVMEALLLLYVKRGVARQGVTLSELCGRRWKSAKDVVRDVAIAIGFFLVFEAVAIFLPMLFSPDNAKTVDILLPINLVEILVWIAVSVTAGFVEELVFRGYLMTQLRALSGNVWVANAGQAIVFGVMHGYQGMTNVAVIAVLALLFGALAIWRKSLLPGMVSHAASDIWGGWLKHLVGFPY